MFHRVPLRHGSCMGPRSFGQRRIPFQRGQPMCCPLVIDSFEQAPLSHICTGLRRGNSS